MTAIIRGLDQMLIDLDQRQRPGATSKNKPLQKTRLVADTVLFSSDSVTTFVDSSFPKVWAGGTAASTGFELYWSFGQWQ